MDKPKDDFNMDHDDFLGSMFLEYAKERLLQGGIENDKTLKGLACQTDLIKCSLILIDVVKNMQVRMLPHSPVTGLCLLKTASKIIESFMMETHPDTARGLITESNAISIKALQGFMYCREMEHDMRKGESDNAE